MRASLAFALILTFPMNLPAERRVIDNIEVYILRDSARQTEVRIAPALGLNSYEMTVKGKRVFWSPYKTVGEFAAKPTFLGNPLLWPWANRIDGLHYFVNGRKYALNEELGNVRGGPNRTPIHGLLQYEKRWEVVEAGETSLRARLDFWRYPELMAQFPFAHTIEVEYRLRDGVLEVQTVIRNESKEPMPVSLGFHPYFQVNDAPQEDWRVTLAARERYALSDRLIPTGAVEPNPYRGQIRLGEVALDDVFGSLVRDSDGFARFRVEGRQESVTVEYGPGFDVAVVYSPKCRGFICFEPMTSITNAFNAAHAGWYRGLPSVGPGAEWRGLFRVVPAGF